MDLHQRICEISENPDLAASLGLVISREHEIIRLRRPAVMIDINLDGVADGPVYPTLDAENAPFTGTQFVQYSLSSDEQALRVDGVVDPDMKLEIDPDWSDEVRRAMQSTYDQLLELIGTSS